MSALDKQVGGQHYKAMKIQPIEFILANNLGWCEGSAIKYICRHSIKGGKQDLEKAIHYLELLMEQEYPTNPDTSIAASKSKEELSAIIYRPKKLGGAFGIHAHFPNEWEK